MKEELDEIFEEAFTSDIPEPKTVEPMSKEEMLKKMDSTLRLVAERFARQPTMDDVNGEIGIVSGMLKIRNDIADATEEPNYDKEAGRPRA